MKKFQFKKRKIIINKSAGITLIALVVSIIVLLILAGISISMLSGDNGILRRATDVKIANDKAQVEEEMRLAIIAARITTDGSINAGTLKSELQKAGFTVTDITDGIGNLAGYKVSKNTYSNNIDLSTGNFEQVEGLTEAELNALPNGVKELEDEDIPSYLKINGELNPNIKAVITGNVAIPVGFYYVGGTKNEGVVISDNSADSGLGTSHAVAQTLAGNQFVWVPVDNTTDFVRYKHYYNKQPQAITNYYEPSKTGYQYSTEAAEYTAMYNSVTGNKGFYVARYEASSSNNSSTGNAESKGNKTPWTSIAWGDSMTSIGTSGAVYKSQQMYTNRATHGVTSTLIYGTQWDAIMAWIDPAYKTSTSAVEDDSTNNIEKSYVANSEGRGYYSTATVTLSSATNTASDSNYAVKNIYDLAGNVMEWTMEAYGTLDRAWRRRPLCCRWL